MEEVLTCECGTFNTLRSRVAIGIREGLTDSLEKRVEKDEMGETILQKL